MTLSAVATLTVEKKRRKHSMLGQKNISETDKCMVSAVVCCRSWQPMISTDWCSFCEWSFTRSIGAVPNRSLNGFVGPDGSGRRRAVRTCGKASRNSETRSAAWIAKWNMALRSSAVCDEKSTAVRYGAKI